LQLSWSWRGGEEDLTLRRKLERKGGKKMAKKGRGNVQAVQTVLLGGVAGSMVKKIKIGKF